MALALAIGLVGFQTVQVWREAPSDSLRGEKRKPSETPVKPTSGPRRATRASIKSITDRNLFDPKRGTEEKTDAKEVKPSSEGIQKMRHLMLLGTVVAGRSGYAIIHFPAAFGASTAGRVGDVMRLSLGDRLEGFELAEIHTDRVLFKKGETKIELALDFSRKLVRPTQRAGRARTRRTTAKRAPRARSLSRKAARR